MALHLMAHPKWQNGKRYVYYSLAESVREGGRIRKRVLAHVGKLSEEQAQKIRQTLALKSDTSLELMDPKQIRCLESVRFLDLSVFHQLWMRLGLSKILQAGQGDVELSKLLEILVVNRCCDPKSKLGVTRWYPTTFLDQLIEVPAEAISETRLYRALPSIERHHQAIEKHLFGWLAKRWPFSESSLYFYDLSSSYFEGQCVSMGAYSENTKDHRPDRLQVVLGLLMNERGLPFSWELFRGNQGDAPTLKTQIKKFQKRFGIRQATLVFDRGFLSNDNLEKVEEAGYSYVTGLDSPQIETLLSLYPQDWLNTINADTCEETVKKQKGWHCFEDTQFYCSLGVVNNRQTILLFDVARFRLAVLKRQEKIEAFKRWVHQHNQWLAGFKQHAEKSAIEKDVQAELKRRHLTPYITCELHEYITENETFVRRKNNPYPSQGYLKKVRSFQINVKENNRHSLDGLFALITSQDSPLSSEAMIAAYRQKYLIEGAFREIKSILKLRPWYVYKEEHVQAHYTICVVAYFLERLLDLELEQQKLKDEGWTLLALKEQLETVRLATFQIGNTTRSVVQSVPNHLESVLEKLALKKALRPNLPTM